MKIWFLTILKVAVCGYSGGLCAQAQQCLRDVSWPSSYSAHTTGTPGAYVTQIHLNPPIHADVLFNSPRVESGRIILEIAMTDSCSGYGEKPVLQVISFLSNLAPGNYAVSAYVEEIGFGFASEYPVVELPELRIGTPASIPILNSVHSNALLFVVLLLAALIATKKYALKL